LKPSPAQESRVYLDTATVAQTFQSAVSQVFNLLERVKSQEFFGEPTRRRLESRRNGGLESPRYRLLSYGA
jgi:hypothetical protein